MTVNSTFTSGAVLTASQMNNLPFGYAGYVSNTSMSLNVTSMTDLTSLSVTFTAVAGRVYRVDGWCLLKSTVIADGANLLIRNGSNTILGQGIVHMEVNNQDYTAQVSTIITASGSTTVKLSAQRQTGTGTITASAGATFPAQIVVTDLGNV
jgi:hypothetical protein